MQVWELMKALSDAPAGAEVLIASPNTANAPIELAEMYDTMQFQIQAADFECVDKDKPRGLLSELVKKK